MADFALAPPDLGGSCEAIHVRHMAVHQDASGCSVRQDFQSGQAAVRHGCSIAQSLEQELGDTPVHVDIIDNEDQRRIYYACLRRGTTLR